MYPPFALLISDGDKKIQRCDSRVTLNKFGRDLSGVYKEYCNTGDKPVRTCPTRLSKYGFAVSTDPKKCGVVTTHRSFRRGPIKISVPNANRWHAIKKSLNSYSTSVETYGVDIRFMKFGDGIDCGREYGYRDQSHHHGML